MPERHLCVGTTCWICGEPSELREMRRSILHEFWTDRDDQHITRDQCHALANLAAKAIRSEVIALLMAHAEEANRAWRAERRLDELSPGGEE